MSEERKIFGQPIRKETTLEFYPDKLTLKEFCDEIRESIDGYQQNMEMIERMRDGSYYIEEWYEGFGAWMEVEEEPK